MAITKTPILQNLGYLIPCNVFLLRLYRSGSRLVYVSVNMEGRPAFINYQFHQSYSLELFRSDLSQSVRYIRCQCQPEKRPGFYELVMSVSDHYHDSEVKYNGPSASDINNSGLSAFLAGTDTVKL